MSDLAAVQDFRGFVDAWERWDARSGNEDAMSDLCGAVDKVAVRWEVPPSLVILVMQEERRVEPGGSTLTAAERTQARLTVRGAAAEWAARPRLDIRGGPAGAS